MRCALYARFSTDQKSAASIGDQLHACRQLAQRLGHTVVAVHSDAAISGAATVNRPGLQALLAETRAGAFEIVIAEALDRLTRSGGDAWDLYEDLAAVGVKIITLSEGEVEELAIGLKGTMNALFLRELARKTRRGLDGVAREGRHAGGRTFGYRIDRTPDAVTGLPVPGRRVVDPDEAAVVVRIFEDYTAGFSPRAIAARLNAEGRPGPSGRAWNASTINGNAQRGNGILHNDLYRGQLVWGRQTWVKDRRTGKRRARAGDPAAVVRTPAPDLRIVSDLLWDQVQAAYRKARHAVDAAGGRPGAANRPRHLLSGLVRCGLCEGPMVVAGADGRMACSTRRERGPAACANGRSAKAADLEARVLAAIEAELLHPDTIEAAAREYRAAKAANRRTAAGARERAEKALAEVRRRAARLVDQVADGQMEGRAVKTALADLAAKEDALEADLARFDADAAADGVVGLHPAAPLRFRLIVERLKVFLADPSMQDHIEREAARGLLRSLVQAVRVTPLEGRGQYALEIDSDLARILQATNAKGPLAGASGASVMTALGAGTGFEPVTFRL